MNFYQFFEVLFGLTKNNLLDDYGYVDDDANLLSGTNILMSAVLGSILWSRSLISIREKTLFLLCLFGFVTFFIFQNNPVIAHRFKEMFFVFLVPLLFRLDMTKQTRLPYVMCAALAGWSFYSHLSLGLIGGGL
jgi:hypothetical protein